MTKRDEMFAAIAGTDDLKETKMITPHEFTSGVIFKHRCRECSLREDEHPTQTEPEKPIDENCTCWSPDGGHDGDCGIWTVIMNPAEEAAKRDRLERQWPPATMETKERANAQIWQCEGCKRTYPEYVNGCPFADNDPTHPRQRSVVVAHETMNVSLHSTNESAGQFPPPSATSVSYTAEDLAAKMPLEVEKAVVIDVTKVCTCWPSGHPGHDGDCHIWGRMND